MPPKQFQATPTRNKASPSPANSQRGAPPTKVAQEVRAPPKVAEEAEQLIPGSQQRSDDAPPARLPPPASGGKKPQRRASFSPGATTAPVSYEKTYTFKDGFLVKVGDEVDIGPVTVLKLALGMLLLVLVVLVLSHGATREYFASLLVFAQPFIDWLMVPYSEGSCPDGLLVAGPEISRGNAVWYLTLLFYCFVGVAIGADVFMAAIEEITSKEEVKTVKVVGGFRKFTVTVWNPTVANLTLMALGSSAPEILLSVIEISGGSFYSGELGPSTIVGSAAFNMLVISAGKKRRGLRDAGGVSSAWGLQPHSLRPAHPLVGFRVRQFTRAPRPRPPKTAEHAAAPFCSFSRRLAPPPFERSLRVGDPKRRDAHDQ